MLYHTMRAALRGLLGGTGCAELGGGWSSQSLSEIFGLLSALLKHSSQGKTLRPTLAEKSKHHPDIFLPSGWSGPLLHVSLCSSLTLPTRVIVGCRVWVRHSDGQASNPSTPPDIQSYLAPFFMSLTALP